MSKGRDKETSGEIDTSKVETIQKVVKRIEMDARSPCRYNGIASVEFVRVAAGAVVRGIIEPQIPFRIRRIIADSPGFTIDQLTIGVNLQLQVAYEMRIASEILMSDRHPIEWGCDPEPDKPEREEEVRLMMRKRNGLDVVMPGMHVGLRIINRNSAPVSTTILLLGDAAW